MFIVICLEYIFFIVFKDKSDPESNEKTWNHPEDIVQVKVTLLLGIQQHSSWNLKSVFFFFFPLLVTIGIAEYLKYEASGKE